jgi:hypothetical protein
LNSDQNKLLVIDAKATAIIYALCEEDRQKVRRANETEAKDSREDNDKPEFKKKSMGTVVFEPITVINLFP